MVKYTIRWESDGRKVPVCCGKNGYQFPRLFQFDGFYCNFSCYGKLTGKPMDMNVMEKKHPYSAKNMSTNFPGFPHRMGLVRFSQKPISQAFPIWWVFLPFPMLWENDEKTHAFPIWWSIPQDGNLIEKTTHFMEKVWEPISQAFPIWWVLLTFLMLWEIWWDNPCIFHAMKYTIGWKSNGKKAPILWQNYEYQFPMFSIYNGFCWILLGTNFPGFPHSVGLAVFSCIMGNWLENTCISHVMKYTIKWESNEKTASIQWENHEYQFPRLSPIWWILLYFPVLWKIDREAHAFSIWWSIW